MCERVIYLQSFITFFEAGRPIEKEEYFFFDDIVKTSKKRHETMRRHNGVWKMALNRFNRLKIQGPMYVHWALRKNNSLI